MRKKYNLPVPIEHSISTLSEYINLISSGKYSNCIYRGEQQRYSYNNASAFRRTKESGKTYPFFSYEK